MSRLSPGNLGPSKQRDSEALNLHVLGLLHTAFLSKLGS